MGFRVKPSIDSGLRRNLRAAPRAFARFPDPVPRIEPPFLPVVTNRLVRLWVRRLWDRRSLTSRSDAPHAATLARIVQRTFLTSISFGQPCRWPPTPAVPAIPCFARPSLGEPDSVSGAFSFFAVHFRARRRREIYECTLESPSFFRCVRRSYPPARGKSMFDRMKRGAQRGG